MDIDDIVYLAAEVYIQYLVHTLSQDNPFMRAT